MDTEADLMDSDSSTPPGRPSPGRRKCRGPRRRAIVQAKPSMDDSDSSDDSDTDPDVDSDNDLPSNDNDDGYAEITRNLIDRMRDRWEW
jgi:hypothetical protein